MGQATDFGGGGHAWCTLVLELLSWTCLLGLRAVERISVVSFPEECHCPCSWGHCNVWWAFVVCYAA